MRRHNLPTWVLGFIWVLCCAGLAWLWFDREGQLRNTVWHKPEPVLAAITPAAIVEPAGLGADAARFAPIVDRPLPATDRRPPPPPPPPAPPPPPPPPDALAGARIYGLIAGEQGAVLLRAEGRMLTVQLEKNVGDWLLKSIEARSATFTRNDETRVLPLEYSKLNAPPPPQAARAAGPATGGPAASVAGIAIPNNLPDEARKELEERLRRRAAAANR
jgi:hypothetical protein